MKYSEMKDRQAQALTALYLSIVSVRTREDHEFSAAGLRLLVVGNSGGIALLGSFMVSMANRGAGYRVYVPPLTCFVVGAVLAALTYIPLIIVAGEAARHFGATMEKFFQDQLPSEQLQNYGFSSRGRRIALTLLTLSILCFFSATVWTLTLLLRS